MQKFIHHIKSDNQIKWQGISFTDQAVDRIKEIMQQNPNTVGLYLSIKKSGCAGFGYLLDTVTKDSEGNLQIADKDYLVFEKGIAKVYVPINAMPFIDGTEIDFVKEELKEQFKFNNPKAKNACGCGESFSI